TAEKQVIIQSDGTMTLKSPWKEAIHRLEWRYYIRKDGKGRDKHVSQVIRKLRVNGDSLLAVEYDRDNNIETLFDHNQLALLRITYDGVGRPQKT
ncbi:hypothetical protein CHUAL_013954, partial [Chamberlinius hualienensis]